MDVKSEMAANVWQVYVEPGQKVAEGDTLMMLESMKMEIPVDAPAAGIVTSVLVEPGVDVREGQLLVTIDKDVSGDAAEGAKSD